jgi:hypothetical protein
MDIDYRTGGHCIGDFSLEAALQRSDVQRVLTDRGLQTLVITAYDGTGFRHCTTHDYLSPTWYTDANTEQLENEYADLAYRLRVLTHVSPKQIILSNWEGDNALYCGSAHMFIESATFRASCRDSYASIVPGGSGPGDGVQGMILWHRARYKGVQDGNKRADVAGIGSPRILVAPEISSVWMLRASGYASVLHDVVPAVPYDLISFSSYEALAGSPKALRAALDEIRRVTGSDQVMIGELGFPRSVHGAMETVRKTREALDEALNWGVRYVIIWNLSDANEGESYGMYDFSGRLTEVGVFVRNYLAASRNGGEGPRAALEYRGRR